VMKRKIRNK